MGIPFKWMDDKSDSAEHQLEKNKQTSEFGNEI